MPRRTLLVRCIGAAVALGVLLLVVLIAARHATPAPSHGHDDLARVEPAAPRSTPELTTAPEPTTSRSAPQDAPRREASAQPSRSGVAARIADDGGVRATAVARSAPPARTPEPEPEPHTASTVVLDHPTTPEENLSRTARVYDFILVRRHDLRRSIEALEQSGDVHRLPQLRRELAALDESVDGARRRLDELSVEVRDARGERTTAPQ